MAHETETTLDDLDVSVAHWHVTAWGGAEYLVTRLAEALDISTVYTLGEPEPDDPNPYGDIEFHDLTSSLDYSTLRRAQQRIGRVFEYAQWEDIDWRLFGNPDVLVTSGATTRSVITPDDTLHMNYCHSPPRWLYDLYHDRKDSLIGMFTRPLIRYLRVRDAALDSRVDHYFVNSPIIKRRLWKFYKRESTLLYPPIEIDSYHSKTDDGYFLHLGRLDKQKGILAVIDAFEGLDSRLVLAGGRGDISDTAIERIRAASNIKYHGFVGEKEKRRLLANCRAVVFNGKNEDFGIVPVEANASGKPVLSRNDGFPGVFIDDGINGLLHDGTSKGIRLAVEQINSDSPFDIHVDLSSFSPDNFEKTLTQQIVTAYVKHIPTE